MYTHLLVFIWLLILDTAATTSDTDITDRFDFRYWTKR